jgi:hypothetical protein
MEASCLTIEKVPIVRPKSPIREVQHSDQRQTATTGTLPRERLSPGRQSGLFRQTYRLRSAWCRSKAMPSAAAPGSTHGNQAPQMFDLCSASLRAPEIEVFSLPLRKSMSFQLVGLLFTKTAQS